MQNEASYQITEIAELERIYGAVAPPSIAKVTDHIHAVYRPFIEAAPFAVLATSGLRRFGCFSARRSGGFYSH